ncbi:hypothetical protein QAD02_021230 [Eretmocerus hayati]|uniref:Uncharacterized protein n=1 Tax=Eretmocerus hayati TaxID=131215 RepID=A0ACC2PSV5_9HYME|nr:hypothetical protein QAD02_021230 [Eretmocerus hayati]
MGDRAIDRHKVKRDYKPGNEKRREKDEKDKKAYELLTKTHRMTDFFKSDRDGPCVSMLNAEDEEHRNSIDVDLHGESREKSVAIEILDQIPQGCPKGNEPQMQDDQKIEIDR